MLVPLLLGILRFTVETFPFFRNVEEIDDLCEMSAELGCTTANLKAQYERLQNICVVGCKAKLVFFIYGANNTDKVLMKKQAVAISNHLQAYEIDPSKVESVAHILKAIKKFQFLAAK